MSNSPFLEQLRTDLRTKHDSIRSEKAYLMKNVTQVRWEIKKSNDF